MQMGNRCLAAIQSKKLVMSLNFNSQGFLHETILLSYEEFQYHFGTNSRRMDQINNALPFFRLFHSCGCQTVYIDGSFVSKKKYPGDIDICFDLTPVDKEKISTVFPQFFEPNEIGRIHRDLQCHIFYYYEDVPYYLDLLKEDRNGNPKGLVRLDINDILIYYDQK
jgi:hypothetical protein